MPCLLALVIVFFPRVAILLLYFFTNFFQGVYTTIIWPILGLLLLPVTLLAYTWLAKTNQPMDTVFYVVIAIAVILDLGLMGGSARRRRRD
jgi:hypothetical protein